MVVHCVIFTGGEHMFLSFATAELLCLGIKVEEPGNQTRSILTMCAV